MHVSESQTVTGGVYKIFSQFHRNFSDLRLLAIPLSHFQVAENYKTIFNLLTIYCFIIVIQTKEIFKDLLQITLLLLVEIPIVAN